MISYPRKIKNLKKFESYYVSSYPSSDEIATVIFIKLTLSPFGYTRFKYKQNNSGSAH